MAGRQQVAPQSRCPFVPAPRAAWPSQRPPPSRPFPGTVTPGAPPVAFRMGVGPWHSLPNSAGRRSGWESCCPEQDPQSAKVPALPGPLLGVTRAPKSSVPQIQPLCVTCLSFPTFHFRQWPHPGHGHTQGSLALLELSPRNFQAPCSLSQVLTGCQWIPIQGKTLARTPLSPRGG